MKRCGAAPSSVVAVLLLVAMPMTAWCQAELLPRLETIPSPAPVNRPFYAIVSLQAYPSALAFYTDTLLVEGNSITAHFDSECVILCPGGPEYAGFPLPMPALAPGQYTLTIVDAGFPDYTVATFSLAISPGQAPAFITHPSPPPANQPFDAELLILAHPDDFGIYPPVEVNGNQITIGFDDYSYCASTCSNESVYRSFPVQFPALDAGTYDVKFIAGFVSEYYFPAPPLPPVADFSMTVSATPSSIPAVSVPALLVVALLLIALAWRALLWRSSRTGS